MRAIVLLGLAIFGCKSEDRLDVVKDGCEDTTISLINDGNGLDTSEHPQRPCGVPPVDGEEAPTRDIELENEENLAGSSENTSSEETSTASEPLAKPAGIQVSGASFDISLRKAWAGVFVSAGEPCDECGFTIEPDLPDGMTLDKDTGAVSGIPVEMSPKRTYTLTVKNQAGSASASFDLAVGNDQFELSALEEVAGSSLPAISGDGAVYSIEETVYKFGGAYNGTWACTGNGGSHILSAPMGDLNDWTDHGPVLPEKFSYGGLSLRIGDEIFLFSSACSNKILKTSVDDPINGWIDTGATISADQPYFSHVAVVGDKVYNFGNGASYDQIWVAPATDPVSWQNTGKTLPGNAQYTYLLKADAKLYIVKDGAPGQIWSADVSVPDEWSSLGDTIDVPANGGYATVLGDTAYIFGGHNVDTVYSAPVDDILNWSDTGVSLPTAGYWGINAQAVINSTLYFIGGQRSAPQDTFKGGQNIIRVPLTRVYQ